MERKIGEAAREESEATQRCVLPAPEEDDVVIENDQMKLVIGANAIVKSLLFKPTGEECLITGKNRRYLFQKNPVVLSFPLVTAGTLKSRV